MQIHRVKNLIALIVWLGSLPLLGGCSSDKGVPGYVKKIPSFGLYTYVPASDWKTQLDTLHPVLWYNPETANQPTFRRVGDIAAVDSSLWISDPLTGKIFKFNKSGTYRQLVVPNGRGPNEVARPSAMYVLKNPKEGKPLVYVIDPGLKSVIVFDGTGQEQGRIYHKTIDRSYFANWVVVPGANKLIWPTYSLKNHLLVEVDSTGKVRQTMLDRLIPIGHQPETYNSIIYDVERDGTTYAFSYRGLPLVFWGHGTQKRLINLLPETPLEEINVPLDPRPENTVFTVKNLVKDLYFFHDKIFLLFKNYLLIISPDDDQIKGYRILDGNDEAFGIHKMALAGDELFFINESTLKIYRKSLPNILQG